MPTTPSADALPPRPPRVLLATTVDPCLIGGVQRNLSMISAAVAAHGLDTSLVARPFHASEKDRRRIMRRAWRRLHPDSEELARLLGAIDAVAACANKAVFDVALAFDAWAAIAVVEAGLPTVFRTPSNTWTVDEWRINGYFRQDSRRVRRLAERERAAVRACRRVVTLSEKGRALFASLGVPEDRLLVIPNAIDLAEWPERERERDEGPVRLIWVAKLRRRKALRDLAAALALTGTETRSRVRLDVYGSGNDEHNDEYVSARDILSEAGVDTVFHGAVEPDKVRAALAEGDVFVLSSHVEGMCNAVLEAMAAGLPVVATRAGATEEMVAPAARDLLADVGDVEGLARSLERVVADAELRRSTGRANRARVASEFAAEEIGRRYATVLRVAAEG